MADEFKMTLPIFDGNDYSTWKKRITIFLKMKKCEKVIERERIETENGNTWNETDLRAMNYIYSTLSNRQMEFIDDKTTSYGIIKKLDKIYLRESTALQICVRNKLEKIKLRDYTEASEFYSKFEKLIIELKNAGARITEKEKLNYLLRTLLTSLSHIGDLVDVLTITDQTVEYVINKIKTYEDKEKDENNGVRNRSGNSNVFKIERKRDNKCYKCGREGHWQNECTSQVRTGSTSRGGNQHQAGGNVRYFTQQQRGNINYPRSNNNYRDRGTSHRGQGGQYCQEQQGADPGRMTFTIEIQKNVNLYNVEVNNCENMIE